MNSKLRLGLPIGTFVILLVAVMITLLVISKKRIMTHEKSSDRVVPSLPPEQLKGGIAVQQQPKAPCLPTSDQFTNLKQCSTQFDCNSCSETPTSCVTVGSQGEVEDDLTLKKPVTVNVAITSTEDCSGRGTRDETTGKCVCDGEWNEDGECVSGACFKGDSCELGEFAISKAGQYCLPSYLGKCNEFTSDTVLTTDSSGRTTWTCRCKQELAGVYTQSVEGGSCDVQVACGAPVGVQKLVNVGTLEQPQYEEKTVYPNRITSHSDETYGSEPCAYKTQNKDGNIVPDDQADPTCIPRLYSNKCTITTGGGNTQVIRGSGMPGDPEIKRASPPFYAPVPPGMNVCPDGWSGKGTPSNPCTDGTNSFAIFTDNGREWLLGRRCDRLVGKWDVRRNDDLVPITHTMETQTLFKFDGVDNEGYNWYSSDMTDPDGIPTLEMGFLEESNGNGERITYVKFRARIAWTAGKSNLYDAWSQPLGGGEEGSYENPVAIAIGEGECLSPEDYSIDGELYVNGVHKTFSLKVNGLSHHPPVGSLAELKSWWSTYNGGAWWGVNTVEISDVRCLEAVFEEGYVATASEPESKVCVDSECTSGLGWRKKAWDGNEDGPLVNENHEPHWVTGGSYGGQCSCDGESQIPSYVQSDTDTPETWWSCKGDTCPTAQFPNGKYNESSQKCECDGSDTNVMTQIPFNNGMNYKHPNTPATCVKDPCNPMGVNVNSAEVKCESESDCGGVCMENQCYIPSSTLCRTDLECSNQMFGVSQNVAKCIIPDGSEDGMGTCATLDFQRARMGSTCTTDEHCSLGACTGEEGSKTCTGGCACSSGYHQESDGGLSPLGFTCKDDCIGKCKNGGTCVHLPEGGTECRCTPYYGGETCETPLCAREMEYCDANIPCCSACPCNESEKGCCNRFPLEETAGGKPMACINNVCQENTSFNDLFATTCTSPSEGCAHVPFASWYTSNPPPCSGWGHQDEDGTCVCHPTRAGDSCEVQVCSTKNQVCGADSDCCNYCECPESEQDCCPLYDSKSGPQKCVEGTCQVAPPTPVTTCKTDFKCNPTCYPLDGTWGISVDGTTYKELHFRQTDLENFWAQLDPSLGQTYFQLDIQQLEGGVSVEVYRGSSHPLPPTYNENIFIQGATYDGSNICMSGPFAKDQDSNSFIWYTSTPDEVEVVLEPVACHKMSGSDYFEISVHPNPDFPDVPYQFNTGDDPLKPYYYPEGGGSKLNVNMELSSDPNDSGVIVSTAPESDSEYGVRIHLVDLVQAGTSTDPEVSVTMEIGYLGQAPVHTTSFIIPGAHLEIEVPVPGPISGSVTNSIICLPGSVGQDPNSLFSFIRYEY